MHAKELVICAATNLFSRVSDEKAINSWFDSPPESSWLVSREAALAVREKAKPFVEWLQTADEESD